MEKSKEAIEIEFSKAIQQADELEGVACALSSIAGSLSSTDIANFEKSWKGSNANLISMKWRNLSGDMFETAQTIMQIAKSIRTTADLVYKAEKAAILLAYY